MTPYLLHRGVLPRLVVGSVNTAEVAVAFVSVGTLLSALGGEGLRLSVVLAMLLGGVIAAPLAAYVVRFIAPRLLGLAVAGLLLVTQSRELASYYGVGGGRWLVWLGILAAVGYAAVRPRRRRYSRVA